MGSPRSQVDRAVPTDGVEGNLHPRTRLVLAPQNVETPVAEAGPVKSEQAKGSVGIDTIDEPQDDVRFAVERSGDPLQLAADRRGVGG